MHAAASDIKPVFSLCFVSLSVRAVYNELHNTLMAIDEQEDLRWWKNTHGPGMPTNWPHFQVTQFLRIGLYFKIGNDLLLK